MPPSAEDSMRPPSLVVRSLFVAAAVCVMVSGISWWVHQRAHANAHPVTNASALVYNGSAPVSKQLARTLSSYHATDREKKLFRKFTQAEENKDTQMMRTVLRTMAKSYESA